MKQKKVLDHNDPLARFIASLCWSEWEGCACGLKKDHEGLHKCGSELCPCTWTDEQAEQWWVEFQQELGEVRPHRRRRS